MTQIMSSWADESDDHLQPAPASYTGERPKLNLKPRSQAAATSSTAASSSIFGAAKPREEVLQSKGIDPKAVEKRVEKKASIVRFTAEQNRQVEALRAELTAFEEKLREANENELPEEEYRVAAEEKRTELNALMKEFQELNVKEGVEPEKEKDGDAGKPQRKFERPSERRRRLEQQRRQEGGGGYHHHGGGGGHRYNDDFEDGDDPYASFGGTNRRGSGRGRGGGGYNRDGGYNDRGSHGGGYNDRGSRGSYSNRGERRSYDNDYEGGGRRRYNDDKYAGDRYNY